MMRQLGGSFGIAIITTYIARINQEHRVNMIGYLDNTSFEVQQRVHQLQMGFMSKGYAMNEALAKAYKTLEMMVTQQAAVLTFSDIFLYLGYLFLFCIPFILLVKKGKNKINPADAMH